MPAYNFKAEFAEAVSTGAKRQTIRRVRKRPTERGDPLYLYTGMRTKKCKLIASVKYCESVMPIDIDIFGDVYVNGRRLDMLQKIKLSKADGFYEPKDFIDFFRKTYCLPFHGEIIKW